MSARCSLSLKLVKVGEKKLFSKNIKIQIMLLIIEDLFQTIMQSRTLTKHTGLPAKN